MNIGSNPLVRDWENSVGFSINGHADVAGLDCKQTRQYGLESSIDDYSEVKNVDSVTFALFTMNAALA